MNNLWTRDRLKRGKVQLYKARILRQCNVKSFFVEKKFSLKDFIVCGEAKMSPDQTPRGFNVNSDKMPRVGGINGFKQHMMLWVDDKKMNL